MNGTADARDRGSLMHLIRRAERGLRAMRSYRPDANDTLALQLERLAARRPARPFLLYGDRRFSYAEANAHINRYAHAYAQLGVVRGDVIALMVENRPEFLWNVLALHKLGAVSSLINTQLTSDVLVHALRVCEPKRIVIGSELWPAFAAVAHQLTEAERAATLVDVDPEHPSVTEAPSLTALAASAPDANPATTAAQRLGDLAAYIYTSGTTGMPKPALIKHERLYRAGLAWSSLALDYRPGDVMYNCLPLYHSNALLLATGSVITGGVTLALARKFSRSRFWDDVRKYGATSFIYIGELCRYLYNAEPTPRDRDHKLRVITGNGLRPDLWPEFQRRFGIPRVAEFYGATEGNCVTINVFNVVGSVGPMLPGMALARWDQERQDFVRDSRGFLVRAKPGEPGILLGRIARAHQFDGYRDRRETERKIIRNAFAPGDAWFNTGDLLKRDRLHHLSFVDRIGDTFRWKGENVSTSEVEAEIAKWPRAAEVNVYGVQIPGVEGRAGMVALALAPGQTFDPDSFKAHVDGALPAYARPIFVRLQSEIATTGTFKMKKVELQREGFDPSATDEPIYVRHPQQDAYVRVDAELFRRINAGELRL